MPVAAPRLLFRRKHESVLRWISVHVPELLYPLLGRPHEDALCVHGSGGFVKESALSFGEGHLNTGTNRVGRNEDTFSIPE